MAWTTRTTWLAGFALAFATVASACGSSKPSIGFNADAGTGTDTGGGPLMPTTNLGGGDGGVLQGTDGSMPQQTAPSGPISLSACQACMSAGGTCGTNMCTISENPGMVSMPVQGQLMAGGTGDAAFAFLYPYDQTVFPQGLLSPTLQFGGVAPDAAVVTVTGAGFAYTGFYGSSQPGRIKMSQAVWTALTLSAQGPLTVDVTKVSGGMVAGPIKETWTIAHGSLKGTIYYETYGSPLAGGLGGVGIMQIQPGATAPNVIKSGCGNVCHTASADGSTLVANTAFPAGSASYDLKTNATTLMAVPDDRYTYGGLYPDGSFAISATNFRTWLGLASKLYNTTTGVNIPATGWDGVIKNAGTAAFSPDGLHVAFNHEDTGGGHTLATMNFDHATYTFSNLEDITSDPNNTLAWPAFTPDSQWIAYHAGSNAEFETDMGATGDVYIVNTMSKQVLRLNTLDGYTGSGSTSYLPDNDTNLNFAPTILPEAVGGYFWIVFTTHRSYGNTIASMAADSEGDDDADGKLWVAAMDIPSIGGEFPPTVTDPSHPAFYLDGQETTADNLRGFWVLNPCKADGSSCQSGDQCCGGYCSGGDAGTGTCSSMSTGCSAEYDKCTTASDCCNPADLCINGKCAEQTP